LKGGLILSKKSLLTFVGLTLWGLIFGASFGFNLGLFVIMVIVLFGGLLWKHVWFSYGKIFWLGISGAIGFALRPAMLFPTEVGFIFGLVMLGLMIITKVAMTPAKPKAT